MDTSLSLKKAMRSALVLVPELQDTRFAVERILLRLLARPWRPDVGAVQHYQVVEPVIVDIGANRGFSVDAFLMLRNKAHVVAFEPLSRLSAILRRRYEANGNVIIHSCALGAETSTFTLYIPIYHRYLFDSLASLDYSAAANWINADRVYFFNPRKLRIEKEIVAVRRLDDFALQPDLIKIYAQGYEPEIIHGSETTIRKYEPAIMVPARIPRIDACLRDLGYTRYAFRNSRLWHEGEGHTSS